MIRAKLLASALLFGAAAPGAAAITLGSAAQFAVLAGSTITNTGTTTIVGDVGVAPGTAMTGFSAVSLTGAAHGNDQVAVAAQSDVGMAYDAVAAASGAVVMSGQDLGGRILLPGVYRFASSAQLTGTLTLDDRGAPGGQFLFQIGSTLTTASNAAVVVLGGTADDVFYQVGSSATLGGGTQFAGNILAAASITFDGEASIAGRALARTGAVTLIGNTIALPADAVAPLPEPATWLLLAGGFGAIGAGLRRQRSALPFA